MSNPIRKLASFTNKICLTKCQVDPCDEKYRCCSPIFCNLVRENFPPGIDYESTGHEIPFMGPSGCVVKPEHRPFCSGFLCPGIKSLYPNDWKQYEKLAKKADMPISRDIFKK